ncbi:MAG: prephenate dehydratase [Candidatus Methylacidiphilales bacterium]|nr:prephenate dehydratase [Candidatus Methylacidiphilales bacterium]
MNLQKLRLQIDKIDARLLALLNARTRLAERVGKLKRSSGQAVFAPEREEILLRSLAKSNPGPLTNDSLRAIYREILSASRSRQKPLTVGYFGSEGSYCHQAALSRFGAGDSYVSAPTIPEVFALLDRDEIDTCVVPVENSIEGGVNATLDMLVQTDLKICGEICIRIRHVLMARPGTQKINKIYSHPQAFGQCRQWLLRHYPGVRLVESSSTSHGAELAANEAGSAAIASQFAARRCGLEVLHTNIQDARRNMTRFLVLNRTPAGPSGDDKTSLLFSVSHEVGALGKILRVFSDREINLEKIESRPAMQKEWEYLFFVDVCGHSQDADLAATLDAIRPKTLWLKVLGSYPRAHRHD